MTEAYAWGQNFQLGYFRHPPFWAWVAGAWFSIVPRTIWGFALLSSLNAAVGLCGAYKLAGCFVKGQKRVAAVMLLLVTPFYTFFAFRYNANTIFLSLWPWCAYAFICALERRRTADTIAFGILAACAILSKYNAVDLLGTCLMAALVHPDGETYFRSPSPYLSIGVALLLIAPHLWWLTANHYAPIHYAESQSGHSVRYAAIQALKLVALDAVCLTPVAFMLVVAGGVKWPRPGEMIARCASEPQLRFLTVLAIGPFVLTLLASLVLRVRLTDNTTVAMFCLMPLAFFEWTGFTRFQRVTRITKRAVATTFAGALLWVSVPLPGIAKDRPDMRRTTPLNVALAREATRQWHSITHAALGIVAGDAAIADSVAFFSPDTPKAFIDFNVNHAPWITPSTLSYDGVLAICEHGHDSCAANAARLAVAHPDTHVVEIGVPDPHHRSLIHDYVLTILPPSARVTVPPGTVSLTASRRGRPRMSRAVTQRPLP